MDSLFSLEEESEMEKPELLAPAGDYGCFRAALKAGADAVYIGGQEYGARAYAGNFSRDEVLSALDEAHFYGKKIYLTVNTLMKQEELDRLADFIAPFYEAGLDGVIVQDVGALCVLGKNFPHLPLHASTQMTVTDAEGAKALKRLGIVRVVPARSRCPCQCSSIPMSACSRYRFCGQRRSFLSSRFPSAIRAPRQRE